MGSVASSLYWRANLPRRSTTTSSWTLSPLSDDRARLRVDADRYLFIVSDLHRLLLAGLSVAQPARFWTLPASKLSSLRFLRQDAWLWWEEMAVAYRQAVQGLDYEGYLKYVAAKRGKFKSNIVRCQTRFDTNETRWQVRKPQCNASA